MLGNLNKWNRSDPRSHSGNATADPVCGLRDARAARRIVAWQVRTALGLGLAMLALGAAPVHAAYVSGWGVNFHYDLDAGYKSPSSMTPVPAEVSGLTQVVTGGEWGGGLLANGTVVTWGGNESGQAGNGTIGPYSAKAIVVPGLSGVVEVAGSGEEMMARLANGTVETWGANMFGEQATGTHGIRASVPTPHLVPGITTAKQIATGGATEVALLANGTVMGWGEDNKGQLGDDDGTNMKLAPTPIAGLAHIAQVSVGGMAASGSHVLALTESGTVLALGENGRGQLGNGTKLNSSTPVLVKGLSSVAAVSAGPDHNLALLNNGTVAAWGSDQFGQLGVPGSSVCGPKRTSCSLTPRPVPGLSGVSQALAAVCWSAVLKAGRVYTFGLNRYSTLGDGTKEDKHAPVEIALTGVTSIAGGYLNGFALTPTPIEPEISVVPGPASLTVNWMSTSETERWDVSIRPLTSPLGPWSTGREHLSPSTRSYTFIGLTPGTEYEILVANDSFHHKYGTGAAG